MDEFSVKVNGQEVKNPALKIFVVIMSLVVAMTPVIIFATLVILNAWTAAVLFATVLATVVIAHFILRAMNRYDFVMTTQEDNKTIIVIGIFRESFKKIK